MKIVNDQILMDYLLENYNRTKAKNMLKYKEVKVNGKVITQYDYALKDAFLEGYQSALQARYRDYLVVIVPSDQGSNEKRKFIPNLAIAQSFSAQVIMPIMKTKPYKQSDQPFAARDQVASVLALKEALPAHQKLLLFDDVITSGATLRACTKLLCDSHPQCLELLVLASHSPDNFQP